MNEEAQAANQEKERDQVKQLRAHQKQVDLFQLPPDSEPNETPVAARKQSLHARTLSETSRTPIRRNLNSNSNSYSNHQTPTMPSALSSGGRSAANRLRLQSGSASPALSDSSFVSDQLRAQQEEANSWDDFKNVRVDFGFRPLNLSVHFDRESYIGKGKLFELINLGKGDGARTIGRPSRNSSLGIELDSSLGSEQVMDLLPSLFDEVFNSTMRMEGEKTNEDEVETEVDPKKERLNIESTFRFLCLWLSSLSNPSLDQDYHGSRSSSTTSANRFFSAIKSQLDHLLGRLRGKWIEVDFTPVQGSELHTLILQIHWFRLELAWRTRVISKMKLPFGAGGDLEGFNTQSGVEELDDSDEFRTAAQKMMRGLMTHDLNLTMKSLKDAASSLDRDESEDEIEEEGPSQIRSPIIRDPTAELWVCLIHLLGEASTDQEQSNDTFWSIYEAALMQWLELNQLDKL